MPVTPFVSLAREGIFMVLVGFIGYIGAQNARNVLLSRNSHYTGWNRGTPPLPDMTAYLFSIRSGFSLTFVYPNNFLSNAR